MKDGGLGIPKYRTWVPMTRRRRLAAVLERATKEQDLPLLDALLRGRTLLKEAKQFGQIGQSDLTDAPKQLHKTNLADELYKSVDGRELKESRTHCIPKDSKTLGGGDFVKCVQVRAASLNNGPPGRKRYAHKEYELQGERGPQSHYSGVPQNLG